MKKQEVLERFKSIINDNCDIQVTDNDKFKDLGIDSLTVLEIIFKLEEPVEDGGIDTQIEHLIIPRKENGVITASPSADFTISQIADLIFQEMNKKSLVDKP